MRIIVLKANARRAFVRATRPTALRSAPKGSIATRSNGMPASGCVNNRESRT
jgi:hypothetical protein